MFPIESFKNSVLKIATILQQLDIRFHLTGGITGVAYGEPRLTQDIDIVIENEASLLTVDSLVERLTESKFVFSEDSLRQAINNKRMFQLFDSAESLKLDIYPRQMIEGELSRSEMVEVFDSVTLPIASKVDAAVSKLIWASKGSQKSRRDFRQISKLSSESELRKIRAMARKMQIEELLDELLQESDEIND